MAVEDLPAGIPSFSFPYTGSLDSVTPYILLAHGWNMERWLKDRWGETAFKRLYWQGYGGRFGIFRWPTKTGFFTFNDSELNSWKSGARLRSLLTSLNSRYPGQVRLAAHSMGGVVAGQALRIGSGNPMIVHTYVAMQAALAAHAYEPSATPRSLGLFDSSTPNRYAIYWNNGSPCYFNAAGGAGRYVNFYNVDDLALNLWKPNQDLKPD
ncbi:MAG: alpha/beta hydrolase, partial [Pedosphaera parvula]|nr:alpha/beta hydrolase [Pedosphaera parvula]